MPETAALAACIGAVTLHRMRALRTILLALMLSLPLPVAAQWQDDAARAEAALAAATGDRARLRALTDLVAAQERGQAALRAELRRLDAAAAEAAARVTDETARLAGLAAAAGRLQRMQAADAPLPLLHPGGVADAVRAQILAAALARSDAALRGAVVAELADIAAAHARLRDASAALDRLRDDTAQRRAALIAGAAIPAQPESTASLETIARSAALSSRPPSPPPDSLPLPVLAARIEPAGDGWLVRGEPGALVRSPAAASLRFAGPLGGHRGTVVLELAPGRVLTLAGMGRLLVATGAELGTGDAIGLLPEAPSHTKTTDAPFPAGPLPPDALYMEARDDNRPVDLSDWFAVEEDS